MRKSKDMADIIQFPSAPGNEKSSASPLVPAGPPARPCLPKSRWVVAVLCWPVLLHFAVFCYLAWFVAYGDTDAPR